MEQKKYNYAIYCGRYQPLHSAHLQNIQYGLEIADKIIILVGSAGAARNIRNPFTYEERVDMIRGALCCSMNGGRDACYNRTIFAPVKDFIYSDNDWIAEVQGIVAEIIDPFDDDIRACLLGVKKDRETETYLNFFPQWEFVEQEILPCSCATQIRDSYFSGDVDYRFLDAPETTAEFLRTFRGSEAYHNLSEEQKYVDNYKAQFKSLPYPPIFSTVDAVVICNGHVLMVKRKANPGRGLWALPGGFINQTERIEDAVIRELKEETRIALHKNVLRNAKVAEKVFDAPGRSLRGRTITHASLFVLNGITGLPEVKGSDDAEKAKWFSFIDVMEMRDQLFEDHWDIIFKMLSLSK